ncbi:hypothetical protein ABZ896_46150 [Streptomyces sp. NPDC047072]|uniref:hypothetical protein n=1 Tax=Streptomyces sp. NPDC047072 TaxID=3154809 RepID=UPI003409623F
MESVEPPEEEVRPLELSSDDDEEELELAESSEEELLELSVLVELSEEEPLELVEVSVDELLLVLELVPLLAVVSASACIVPISANIPAAAASVTAAAAAAVRRVPLRTSAAAPLSVPLAMAVPLRSRSDALSRTTFGYGPERSL